MSTIPSSSASGSFVSGVRDTVLVIAFVLPFAGQVLPYGLPLFFAVTCVSLAAALVSRAWTVRWQCLRVPLNGFTLWLSAVLVTVLYGVLLTDRVSGSLAGEVSNAIGMLILYVAAANAFRSPDHRDTLLRHTMNAVLIISAIGAIAGALKFVMLLRGQRFAFLVDPVSGRYPFGTSLVDDYNMFSLTLLCGAVIALIRAIQGSSSLGRLLALGAFLLLIGVGVLAGSRRFWIVAPLAVLGVITLSTLRLGVGRGTKRAMVLVALTGLVVAIAFEYLGQSNWSVMDTTYRTLEVKMLGLLDADRAGGFDARLLRWEYATSLAEGPVVVTGQGFDYLRMFSCEFGDCRSVDYPHNPFLSALLYAGIAGIAAVSGLLVYILRSAGRLLRAQPVPSTYGLLLLIHVPFILVSSNSILSVKSFLISAMLCTFYGMRLNMNQSGAEA